MIEYGPIPASLKLSEHFTFGELSVTDHRQYMAAQDNPPPQVRRNLVVLARAYLEPAHAITGRLRCTSGYRCPPLNEVIRGARNSRHVDGLAADLVPMDMELREAYVRLARSGIRFDQLIYEFGRWLHLGAPLPGVEPRLEQLVIFTPGHYERWTPADPRFRGTKALA